VCHYQVQQLDVPGVVHGLNASGYEYCADTLNSYDAFALPYALFFIFLCYYLTLNERYILQLFRIE